MHVAPREEKNASLYLFCAMVAASAEMRDTPRARPKEPASVCIPCRPTWRVLEKSTPAFLAQSSNFTEAISIPTMVPSVSGCSSLAKSPRLVESENLLEDSYNQHKRRDEIHGDRWARLLANRGCQASRRRGGRGKTVSKRPRLPDFYPNG